MSVNTWQTPNTWAEQGGGITLTADSVMPSMVSASVFNHAVPEYNTSIVSIMPSMASNAVIQNLTLGINSSINSTMPSLISSATFSKVEPKLLDAAINSNMPSMQSFTSIINGDISIVIGEGNNIDIVIKSTNINILTKSRII